MMCSMRPFEGLRAWRPGLLVSGTDTGVGKTLVSCAIAVLLRQQQPQKKLAVIKPFGSGCVRTVRGLEHPDAQLLARYARTDAGAETLCPLRFEAPLAPAVAAEAAGVPMDWPTLGRALEQIQQKADRVLMEGVGGLCVPLDPALPQITVLEMAAWLGWPVLVVARGGLGTLNHTVMSLRLLAAAGVPIAGVVLNHGTGGSEAVSDLAVRSNARWIERMSGQPVLAQVPRISSVQQDLADVSGEPASPLLAALARVDWAGLFRLPVSSAQENPAAQKGWTRPAGFGPVH